MTLVSLGLLFCVLQIVDVNVFGCAIPHVITCADHQTNQSRFTFSSTTTTPSQDRLFVVTEY